MNEQALVAKVWNYAHVLRDDGVSFGDYLGQISFLLFLKMDEERSEHPREPSALPEDCRWATLKTRSGEALERHYKGVLETLSRRDDIVGTLFLKAESKIGDPAKLQRLVGLIGAETWMGQNVDVKGTIYEGLLERNAGEVKSGAGQYFTPRPLIDAIVEVVAPEPGDTVHDPAVGTGGFLLSAYEHMRGKPGARDKRAARALRETALSGTDIVSEVVRLCAMNLYLHGIGGAASPVAQKDALLDRGAASYRIILTNPPFGKRQSFRIVREDGGLDSERQDYVRDDFSVTTGNKQLNFLQHIMSILEVGGSAAVVMPDNVLFEGGAGETLRRRLLHEFDFHTLLRLPTGIFYSQGVKANVLFFDRAPPGSGVATSTFGSTTCGRTSASPCASARCAAPTSTASWRPTARRRRLTSGWRASASGVSLRGAGQARQAEPRRLLAEGRRRHRPRQPAAPGRGRRRDRRQPGAGVGEVQARSGEAGDLNGVSS